LKNKTTKQKET